MDISSPSSEINLEPLSSGSQGMTLAQKAATLEILSGYDPDSLTGKDINEILKAFDRAGIKPSLEHRDLVFSVGFDTHDLRPRENSSFAPSNRKVEEPDKKILLSEMLDELESGKLLDFLQSANPELMKMLEGFEPEELIGLLESKEVDPRMSDERKADARQILATFDPSGERAAGAGKQEFLREMLEMFEVLKMLNSGKWDQSMLEELRSALSVSGNGNAGNMIDRHA